jgi:hypothetical protein
MSTVTPGDRDVLRDAWLRLCADLQAQGLQTIDHLKDVDNPQELAEALRFVARSALFTLQQRMDFNDPDFPIFLRSLDDRFKHSGPDSYITYVNAPVRYENAVYRVKVNHHGRHLNLGEHWTDDLEMEPDGAIEVQLGGERVPGNWQALDPDAVKALGGGYFGRIYFHDPSDPRPVARLNIERIDPGRPRQPEPLSPAKLAEQIASAMEMFRVMTTSAFERTTRIRQETEPNVVTPPSQIPPGRPNFRPPANSPINYGVCSFEIGPDEALVVTSELPECEYWSFQLHTPWWESPDNQHRQTSISHKHAHLDSDGRFRCVLAHRDPGSPNWLDVGGHRRGFLFYRWVRPTSEMPWPVAKLVPLAMVRDQLPAEHPVFGQAARDAQLSQRRQWFASRFQS